MYILKKTLFQKVGCKNKFQWKNRGKCKSRETINNPKTKVTNQETVPTRTKEMIKMKVKAVLKKMEITTIRELSRWKNRTNKTRRTAILLRIKA